MVRLDVSGLPALPDGGYYFLWLSKDGDYAAPCGTFAVGQGETTAEWTVSYDLGAYDEWVVTARMPDARQLRGALAPRSVHRRLAGYSRAGAMTKRTILLIEDERSISEPLMDALAREGFEPILAETAEAGMDVFAQRGPDLVLLDVMLPDGDGRDLLRRIRETSRTPVVMLTARGEEMDRVLGLELGADDYVTKPFSAAELVARMRAVLRRSEREPGGGDGLGARVRRRAARPGHAHRDAATACRST